MTEPSLPTIAAVILAYGPSNRHAALADAVIAQGVAPGNLVIVHNPDRVPNTARVHVPDGARLVQMPSNRGYAAAMNRGIATARRLDDAEAVVLLTHDVELEDGALARLHETAAAHPDYGVLGPVLRQPSVRSGVSYGSAQRADGSVGHITERPAGSALIDVPCVDGSAMYLRLAALPEDPLPERYFMYFEEAYLCSALARAGWRTGSVPAAVAQSTPGGRSRTAAYGYLYARNGLDWTRTFGPDGSGRAFALFQLRRIASNLRRLRDLRASAARLHGLLDQVRGRSGPPPAWVRRASDISAV